MLKGEAAEKNSEIEKLAEDGYFHKADIKDNDHLQYEKPRRKSEKNEYVFNLSQEDIVIFLHESGSNKVIPLIEHNRNTVNIGKWIYDPEKSNIPHFYIVELLKSNNFFELMLVVYRSTSDFKKEDWVVNCMDEIDWEKDQVSMRGKGNSGDLNDCFRTSAVKKIERTDNNLTVTTRNSVYSFTKHVNEIESYTNSKDQ